MANLKYSRQREAIKDYLSSVTTHPTADTVYMHIKEEFPNISLGTVYRNLNLLADIGEAIKITTPDGGDRFDARTNPHYHFYCKCCKRMIDRILITWIRSTISHPKVSTVRLNHTPCFSTVSAVIV